jgi:hypothetical protein
MRAATPFSVLTYLAALASLVGGLICAREPAIKARGCCAQQPSTARVVPANQITAAPCGSCPKPDRATGDPRGRLGQSVAEPGLRKAR